MKVFCTERARRAPLVPITLLALLGGCAEMSFKPGAGPGDFTAAEKSCHASGATGTADYEACMNARGFKLHRRSESIFAGEPAATAQEPEADAAAPAPRAAGVTAAGAVNAAAAAPAAAKKPPPAPPVPKGPVEVSSWWKFGGTAGEFDTARAACIAELKEPPSATIDENVASPALVACLRKSGWFGIAK